MTGGRAWGTAKDNLGRYTLFLFFPIKKEACCNSEGSWKKGNGYGNIKHHSYPNTDTKDSQVMLVEKNPSANAGDVIDVGLIPESGRSPGKENSNPFQYSCLENPMDREAWQATVHRVAKSWTQLKWNSTHDRFIKDMETRNTDKKMRYRKICTALFTVIKMDVIYIGITPLTKEHIWTLSIIFLTISFPYSSILSRIPCCIYWHVSLVSSSLY